MRNEQPTESEARFFDALSAKVPHLQDWYHRDPDGARDAIDKLRFLFEGPAE